MQVSHKTTEASEISGYSKQFVGVATMWIVQLLLCCLCLLLGGSAVQLPNCREVRPVYKVTPKDGALNFYPSQAAAIEAALHAHDHELIFERYPQPHPQPQKRFWSPNDREFTQNPQKPQYDIKLLEIILRLLNTPEDLEAQNQLRTWLMHQIYLLSNQRPVGENMPVISILEKLLQKLRKPTAQISSKWDFELTVKPEGDPQFTEILAVQGSPFQQTLRRPSSYWNLVLPVRNGGPTDLIIDINKYTYPENGKIPDFEWIFKPKSNILPQTTTTTTRRPITTTKPTTTTTKTTTTTRSIPSRRQTQAPNLAGCIEDCP